MLNGLIGRTIGRYTILEQIGQGGMSSVFRAVDRQTDRMVALKVLSPYLANDVNFQARFEREVRLLRKLKHPHIIPLLGHGESEGLAYIVMPFLLAGTLHERLMQGPLDPVLGGRIVDQLASALAFAHERGIVHRDVKPSNVLLDEQGNALLSDFSFARPQETSQNLTGSSLIGTPAYMSPEQCRGEPITARSDQYSFAVMLFQIATGQLPFEGETPMAVAIKHVTTPLPRPREVNPNLPEGVEQVLIRALAKDPALRFDSIRELNASFQAELKAALDPKLRSAAARTVSLDRTQELYRRYQNVKPPAKRRSGSRTSTTFATILLLLACAISAGAIGIMYPQLFGSARAAPATAPVDIQATVESLLTARAPDEGTQMSGGELETAVYAAVLETLQATLSSQAGSPGSGSPTSESNGLTIPPLEGTSSPTAASSATQAATLALGSRTPTRTSAPPSPTTTSAPPSATTAGSTSLPPSSTPTQTLVPTDTPPVPTETATPTETSTLPPATNTLPPPTATSPAPVCEWNVGGVNIYGDTVSVVISNTGDLELHVTGVGISWTNDHEHLVRVRMGATIWSGWDDYPDFNVATSKNVPAGGSRTLEFEFWGSHFDGSASVTVDAGC